MSDYILPHCQIPSTKFSILAAELEVHTRCNRLDIQHGKSTHPAWAIEFADAHPQAYILGTDISPIQPGRALQTAFSSSTIHPMNGYSSSNSTTSTHEPSLSEWVIGIKPVDQVYKQLKPKGWHQIQEFHLPLGCDDGSMAEGSMLWRWGKDINRAAGKVGIDSLATLQLVDRMR